MVIVMADLRCGILLDVKTRARAELATASGTHVVHDGFSDILYVLLPIWAQEFRLSLAQVGLIRTAYTAAMASFQIPAGLLAARKGRVEIGERQAEADEEQEDRCRERHREVHQVIPRPP